MVNIFGVKTSIKVYFDVSFKSFSELKVWWGLSVGVVLLLLIFYFWLNHNLLNFLGCSLCPYTHFLVEV